MSILVTVGAIIMVSFLPGKEAGDTNAKTIDDFEKLETVEEHMRSFMAANRRRPCPAQGSYAVNSANFGKEAAIAGTCSGGTPAAPLSDGGNIVGGTIPTRSLGLDPTYAFDSYGRRFTYLVDKRATTTATCDALMGIAGGSTTPTGKGGLYINDIAGNPIDQVMYAYIQHGPSGYGAFPAQGSTAAGRINSGSTDKWMQIDAAVAVGANPGSSTFVPTLTNTLIKNSMTLPTTSGGLDTGFSDLLWYRDDIKNTCCLGKACIPLGFRVDGNSSIVNTTNDMSVLAIGDINGDGYPDLVVGSAGGVENTVYVIFGTSTMSSSSSTPWPIPPTGFDPTSVNGTTGFSVKFPVAFVGTTATIADLNGDGYGDLIIASSGAGYVYVVFGGPGGVTTQWQPTASSATPSQVSVIGLSGYNTSSNGTSGVIIHESGSGGAFGATTHMLTPAKFEVGKIDDSSTLTGCTATTCSSLIVTGSVNGAGAGYVIYGKPSTGTGPNGATDNWANSGAIDATQLGSTGPNYGFQFYSSDSHLMSTLARGSINGVTGDFDNDGYQDIVINDASATPAGDNGVPGAAGGGSTYILYGRPRATWTSDFVAGGLNGDSAVVNLEAEIIASPNRATEFYSNPGGLVASDLFVADLNGDHYPDMLLSGSFMGATMGIYGNKYPPSGGRWPGIYNVNGITASGLGLAYSYVSNPSWLPTNTGATASAYDLNGDGKLDLLLGYTGASPLSRLNAGGVLVIYQPSGGWPSSTMQYSNFHWDDTDSFQIYGPEAGSKCGSRNMGSGETYPPFAGDVRYGDHGAPEILISCPPDGEDSYGSVYGLYKNKGWPSSIDLNQLN
ncbi:MAG TPA: FG-GAP repeat protein [Pirellulales bacterium]|nr:FG-GAP repeat protein [Pirellulales bacterium]